MIANKFDTSYCTPACMAGSCTVANPSLKVKTCMVIMTIQIPGRLGDWWMTPMIRRSRYSSVRMR